MESTLASKFRIKCPSEINREHTVLVVEDQQDMRLIVSSHLKKLGYPNIRQANNGYDALEFVKETDVPISVIICDIDMPIMDGMTFLAELRDNPENKRPPFALTMDNPSKEKIMHALESGVDEIMVKPFTLNDVMPKVISTFSKFHNPKNPEKVYELAKQLFRMDKLDEAEKVYSVIAADTSKSARPLVGLARVAMKREQWDKAVELTTEAENRNPAFVHLFSARGDAMMKMGQTESAIEAFKKAIELSPLNPKRYEDAAKPLFEAKKFSEGVEILQQALVKELDFPSLHRYLSEGFFALKDFKEAVKHIRIALTAEPENVIFLNQLGISLKESEELEEAMKTYNSIIKLDNDNKAAYYNKAILQYTMGNLDDAVKTLQRTVKKFPDFEPAKRKLGEYEAEQNAA